MDIKSQLFDRIRVQAQRKKEKRIEQPSCAYPDCTQPGIYRAPMGRHREGQYLNFCLEHVRLYNATYNYFSGMSDEAIAKYQKEAAVGHRPTWQIGANSGPHLGDRQGENAPPSLRPRSGRPTKKYLWATPPGP